MAPVAGMTLISAAPEKSRVQVLEEAAAAVRQGAQDVVNGPVLNPAMDLLELQANNTIKLIPRTPLCKPEPLLARVVHVLMQPAGADVERAYWLDWLKPDRLCLQFFDKSLNVAIGYWLMKSRRDSEGRVNWELRAAPYNNIMNLYGGERIPVSLVEKVEIIQAGDGGNNTQTGVDSRRAILDGYRQRATGLFGWNDPDLIKPDLRLIRSRDPSSGRVQTKVQLSTGESYYIDQENMERIRLQQDILAKRKPDLVRMLPGGSFSGLGIRTPPESEYRREWRTLKQGDYVAVQVNVTKPTGDQITTLVLFGRVEARVSSSPLINGLGTVYALDVSNVKGNEDDVFAFAPVRIGRRKIRYWLCVYDDLYDTKVIATSDAVSHDELVQNLQSGDGTMRLAEYAVEDIKPTDEAGVVNDFSDQVVKRNPLVVLGPAKPLAKTRSADEASAVDERVRDRVKQLMQREQDRERLSGFGNRMTHKPRNRYTDFEGASTRAPLIQRVRFNAIKRSDLGHT